MNHHQVWVVRIRMDRMSLHGVTLSINVFEVGGEKMKNLRLKLHDRGWKQRKRFADSLIFVVTAKKNVIGWWSHDELFFFFTRQVIWSLVIRRYALNDHSNDKNNNNNRYW